jgi:hypothetical protein
MLHQEGGNKPTVATIAVWIFCAISVGLRRSVELNDLQQHPGTECKEATTETNLPTAPRGQSAIGSTGKDRLAGLKQTTLVLVALSVSYADMTIRPAIERWIWRTSHADFFSVSWPIDSVWATEASRGWSGDGIAEDEDMAVSEECEAKHSGSWSVFGVSNNDLLYFVQKAASEFRGHYHQRNSYQDVGRCGTVRIYSIR